MIPASHPIPEPEARKPLSKWEFAVLMLEQLGRCKVCGARLEKGKTRDEHVQALHLGGSNDLSNRELWCLDCTKPKDDADKALIAKGKRIRGETCAGPKREIRSGKTWGPSGVSALSKHARGYRKPSWPKRVPREKNADA